MGRICPTRLHGIRRSVHGFATSFTWRPIVVVCAGRVSREAPGLGGIGGQGGTEMAQWQRLGGTRPRRRWHSLAAEGVRLQQLTGVMARWGRSASSKRRREGARVRVWHLGGVLVRCGKGRRSPMTWHGGVDRWGVIVKLAGHGSGELRSGGFHPEVVAWRQWLGAGPELRWRGEAGWPVVLEMTTVEVATASPPTRVWGRSSMTVVPDGEVGGGAWWLWPESSGRRWHSARLGWQRPGAWRSGVGHAFGQRPDKIRRAG
jgi:hypothetical protein